MVDFKINLPHGAEYFVTPKGQNYLHYLIECREVDLLRQLIDVNSDINKKDKFGVSPIYIACVTGDVEIVELLLRNGADPNVKPVPLHAAVKNGQMYLIQLLLNWGAKIDETDILGHNALHIACTVPNIDIKIVKFLLENKCPLNAGKISSAFIFGIARDNFELVKLLNNFRCIDEQKDMSPLRYACFIQANDEILSMLLKTANLSTNNEDAIGAWYYLWYTHR